MFEIEILKLQELISPYDNIALSYNFILVLSAFQFLSFIYEI